MAFAIPDFTTSIYQSTDYFKPPKIEVLSTNQLLSTQPSDRSKILPM